MTTGRATGSLVVSDDEAVALAASIGRAWTAPLPTLAPVTERAGREALGRGVRLLRQRGLLEVGGEGPRLGTRLAGLVPCFCEQPLLVCYAVNLLKPTAFAGAAFFAFAGPSPGECAVDLVVGLGHHEIALMSSHDLADVVASMVLAEFRREAAGVDPLGIVMSTEVERGGAALVVSPGRCRSATFVDAGLGFDVAAEDDALDLDRVRALVLGAAAARSSADG